jgi:tetratricopeptide (TPR) repeat protein
MDGGRVDFFVSHAGCDQAWAEWVAWQLDSAGCTVELDVWDWAAGEHFIHKMNDALDRCDCVVALFSHRYFDRSRYAIEELVVLLLKVPGQPKLVPLRVEEVPVESMPPLVRPLLHHDLFDRDEDEARRVLLGAVGGAAGHSPGKPPFPGGKTAVPLANLGDTGPRLPVKKPEIWKIPPHNPHFWGREKLLGTIRERFLAGNRTAAQSLHGISGVGKSQLALEYAHRFGGTYDLAWWVESPHPGVTGDKFTALGIRLGCVQPGDDTETVRYAVLAELRRRGRWLLVFDNASDASHLREWLPGESGHVLITTREGSLDQIAPSIEVDVLPRPESVTFLTDRVRGLGPVDAGELADELGDLPLAIAQAVEDMREAGFTAANYLDLLRRKTTEILKERRLVGYPDSLVATIELSADNLETEAAELASLCAFFAPEPLPLALFTKSVQELPPPLNDEMVLLKARTQLTWQSLARIDQDALQMHRLTQTILRNRLTDEEKAKKKAYVETILATGHPGDPEDPAVWPAWAQVLPHLLAAIRVDTENVGLRAAACAGCSYLLARGGIDKGYDLAREMYERWRGTLGEDDPATLLAADTLARAMNLRGKHAAAHDLVANTLARRERTLGEDHPDTLASKSNLAATLGMMGKFGYARRLNQETLDGRRRVLGPDHRHTLTTASNLAANLGELGLNSEAKELDKDTLRRLQITLGADHPDTLTTASNLSFTLGRLKESKEAIKLGNNTLTSFRSSLGEDHPRTLACAHDFAATLLALGKTHRAKKLYEDTFARRQRVLGESHRDTLESATALLSILRELGDTQAARQLEEDIRRWKLGEAE